MVVMMRGMFGIGWMYPQNYSIIFISGLIHALDVAIVVTTSIVVDVDGCIGALVVFVVVVADVTRWMSAIAQVALVLLKFGDTKRIMVLLHRLHGLQRLHGLLSITNAYGLRSEND